MFRGQARILFHRAGHIQPVLVVLAQQELLVLCHLGLASSLAGHHQLRNLNAGQGGEIAEQGGPGGWAQEVGGRGGALGGRDGGDGQSGGPVGLGACASGTGLWCGVALVFLVLVLVLVDLVAVFLRSVRVICVGELVLCGEIRDAGLPGLPVDVLCIV